MAASQTPRFAIFRWPLDSDEFTRIQMDTSHQNLEARAGGFYYGASNPTPAAQYERSLFYNTTNQQIYFFNGTDASGSWIPLNDFVDSSRNINIGNGTATTINKVSITAPATSATLTIANGKTVTVSNTLTFSGTDSSSVAFGTGGTVAYTGNKLSVFAATTSTELRGVISDETGTGSLVFSTSPTLTTPNIGVATAVSVNKLSITAPATGSTLTIADGKTLTANNTLIFTGTDASSIAFGTGGTVAYVANNLSAFAATTSAQLASIISDETGTGSLVFATSPTLVTPTLGVATATSINKLAITAPLTSATLTIANGKTFTVNNTLTFSGTDASSVAFGAGGTVAYVANTLDTFASTTSTQLRNVISDETGTGSLVFATSPTLVTPALGAATATSVNNVAFTSPASLATLTLASGSTFATSGAFSTTLTSTAATNVTLPTSGTLATIANTETFTNKSLSDSTSHIINVADTSKRVRFDVSGVTAATTRVLTIPNISGTIITSADTGTVGNTMISAVDYTKVTGLQTWSDGRYYTETEINNAYVYQWGNRPTGAGGALTNARQIYVQADAPTTAQDGDLWFDL